MDIVMREKSLKYVEGEAGAGRAHFKLSSVKFNLNICFSLQRSV